MGCGSSCRRRQSSGTDASYLWKFEVQSWWGLNFAAIIFCQGGNSMTCAFDASPVLGNLCAQGDRFSSLVPTSIQWNCAKLLEMVLLSLCCFSGMEVTASKHKYGWWLCYTAGCSDSWMSALSSAISSLGSGPFSLSLPQFPCEFVLVLWD